MRIHHGFGLFNRHDAGWARANIAMVPLPEHRRGRVVRAANGTRIKESGMKRLKFRTKGGKRLTWLMTATAVKKALKSVATT